MRGSDYRALSLWHDTAGDDFEPRPSLPGPASYDVVVVGAGLTGLWTAYYLQRADPGLRIAVLEQEVAGFGASGRNGGWCSALFPTSWATLVERGGADGALRQHRAMQETVLEVGRVAEAEGIDAHYQRGGTVVMAHTEVQLARMVDEVETARARGFTEDDLRLLSPTDAREQMSTAGALGGTYTPHCAAIHPARLVRGLARVVEGAGVALFEQTRVTAIEPGVVRTDAGDVRAEVILRATEGYTPRLRGLGRAIAPVYSLMVATEPLPDETWSAIGLADRPTFSDGRHLIIYGQRTADGRIAFGGRGAPYHFGSRIRPSYDVEPRVFDELRTVLTTMLPQLPTCASPTSGVAAWASPATGPPRWGWTGARGSAGRAVTSATGWPPPTSPGAPWPTWSRAPTATWSRSRGSDTAAGPGSPSRCAGWGSTPASA